LFVIQLPPLPTAPSSLTKKGASGPVMFLMWCNKRLQWRTWNSSRQKNSHWVC